MPRVSVIIPADNAEAHLDEEQLVALAVAEHPKRWPSYARILAAETSVRSL